MGKIKMSNQQHKTPQTSKRRNTRRKRGFGCLPLFSLILLLPASGGILYSVYMRHAFQSNPLLSPYTKFVGLYFSQTLAQTLICVVLAIIFAFLTYWLYRQARLRPPGSPVKMIRLKRLLILLAFISLLFIALSSLWATETYYAYLDSYYETKISGHFIGVTDGNWGQRLIKLEKEQTAYVFKLNQTLPQEQLHWKDPITLYYGAKTNRVFHLTK